MSDKSYVFFGNLPIGSNGKHSPEGCDFVINTRLKYETGTCSFQLIKQKTPYVYNVETLGNNAEFELDISSLIRLKKFIEWYKDQMTDSEYFHFSSTKITKHLKFQKGVFVSFTKSILNFTMDTKEQLVFKIVGEFQIACFLELLKEILNTLPKAYCNNDMKKVVKKDILEPYKVPVPTTVISGIGAPPPVREVYVGGITDATSTFIPPPPPSVTKDVIPQAPKIPTLN